jgi:hypothetical protein
VHAEARTQVTEARKPCLCRWATSLDANFIFLILPVASSKLMHVFFIKDYSVNGKSFYFYKNIMKIKFFYKKNKNSDKLE